MKKIFLCLFGFLVCFTIRVTESKLLLSKEWNLEVLAAALWIGGTAILLF